MSPTSLPLASNASGATPLSALTSYSAFLFFACMLSTSRGYAVGAVLLLLGSLYYLVTGPRIALVRADKIFITLLLFVFLVGAFSWRYHGNALQSMDLPSRYLLAIPIFLLFLGHPVKLAWLNAGFFVGGLTAGAVAAWQRYSLGEVRVHGFTGGIQFGDLALMMAVFCVAAFVVSDRLFLKPRLWRVALLVGIAGGSYASILSGARGGWVAIPFVMLVFCVAYLRRSNLKWTLAILVALVLAGVIAVPSVPIIKTRFEAAVQDIQMYGQGDATSSLGARFEIWRALAVIIPQKPFMGWSDSAYAEEKRRLVESGEFASPVAELANTHNTFLEIWVHQGLLGLVPVLATLWVSLVFFGKRLRSTDPLIQYLAVSGVCLVGCFMIFGQTQIILGRNNTLLFFLITLVTLWGAIRARTSNSVTRSNLESL